MLSSSWLTFFGTMHRPRMHFKVRPFTFARETEPKGCTTGRQHIKLALPPLKPIPLPIIRWAYSDFPGTTTG